MGVREESDTCTVNVDWRIFPHRGVENSGLHLGPAPSFTPSSLPVLLPVLNLPQSQSVARENRRHTVFMRESSHLSTLNQTQSYIGGFALPRRGSGVQLPFPAPVFQQVTKDVTLTKIGDGGNQVIETTFFFSDADGYKRIPGTRH